MFLSTPARNDTFGEKKHDAKKPGHWLEKSNRTRQTQKNITP
jgi:hypothetical protein